MLAFRVGDPGSNPGRGNFEILCQSRYLVVNKFERSAFASWPQPENSNILFRSELGRLFMIRLMQTTNNAERPYLNKNDTSTVHRLQHMFFAASIVGGTGAILVAAFANPPYYGSAPGIASAVATNAVSTNLMDETHLIAQLVAAYLLPFSFLAMAWLASRRSPWLASIGAFIALLGFLPLPLYVGQDSLYFDIARQANNPQAIALAQLWNSDPIMSLYGIMFGLGTVFGPTLIGIALWRSHEIPGWAAAFLTVSRLLALLFLVVAYTIATTIVLAGVVLLFIGSVPATLAVLKAPSVAPKSQQESAKRRDSNPNSV